MFLSDLKKGERAVVVSINTDSVLKQRLASFGTGKGSEITVVTCSLAKQTIAIEVNDTEVALRFTEAQKIKVEKLQ